MLTKNTGMGFSGWKFAWAAGMLLMAVAACSRPGAPASIVKKMPAGKEFSGFLSSYDNLKPSTVFENTKSWVSGDPAKNIHRYVAVIVDPPAVYVSSDAAGNIPENGAKALTEYFQDAITNAVDDAFPVVQTSGPLVLRLRSAIVGVDAGPAIPADQKDDNKLDRAINIGKVGVEMELVDSVTGEQIAAAVDRQNLGDGAMVGSVHFTREEKFRDATEAFDGWASRLRQFLDSAHELSKEDGDHVEATNFPYAREGTPLH
jgi:hypothetical protein